MRIELTLTLTLTPTLPLPLTLTVNLTSPNRVLGLVDDGLKPGLLDAVDSLDALD